MVVKKMSQTGRQTQVHLLFLNKMRNCRKILWRISLGFTTLGHEVKLMSCRDITVFCFADVNECVTMKPCQNEGACENLPGSYQCTCITGYTGKNCENGAYTSLRSGVLK